MLISIWFDLDEYYNLSKSQFCYLQNGGKICLFVNRVILTKISATWLLSKYQYPLHPTPTLHFPPNLLLPNNSLTRALSYAAIQGAWRMMKKAKRGGSWHLRSRVKFTNSEPWNQPITTLRKVSAEIIFQFLFCSSCSFFSNVHVTFIIILELKSLNAHVESYEMNTF